MSDDEENSDRSWPKEKKQKQGEKDIAITPETIKQAHSDTFDRDHDGFLSHQSFACSDAAAGREAD